MSVIPPGLKHHVNEWISSPALERFERQRERELNQRDRIIYLEESQKSLLVQMKLGFEQVDKRFDEGNKKKTRVNPGRMFSLKEISA